MSLELTQGRFSVSVTSASKMTERGRKNNKQFSEERYAETNKIILQYGLGTGQDETQVIAPISQCPFFPIHKSIRWECG